MSLGHMLKINKHLIMSINMHIFHLKTFVNYSLAYTHKFTVVVDFFFFLNICVQYNFFLKITYIKIPFNEVLNAP